MQLQANAVATLPKQPRAGRPVAVGMYVRRADTGAEIADVDAVGCQAWVGKTQLRRTRAIFAESVAVCVFAIPKSARGKILRGWIGVRVEGTILERKFSRRIA